MDNKKNNQNYILQIMLVVFLTMIIAYPVTLYVKKANNPEASLTEEQLNSFILETVEVKSFDTPSLSRPTSIGSEQKSAKYSTTGQAIMTVNIYNITKLTGEDFTKVGQTPWSLMNTVKSNIATPQVIDLVFNNDNVVNAFMNRDSAKELTSNYLKLYDMLMQSNYAIEKFINNPTVVEVLNNDTALAVVANSQLINKILMSPSGQYFINNPKITKKLVEADDSLKALMGNQKLKKLLLTDKRTKAAAQILFK